jgi:hypothetical protein
MRIELMPKECAYTRELDDEICDRIANGEGLKQICRDAHMPPARTVRRWAIEDREGFAARYARAKCKLKTTSTI